MAGCTEGSKMNRAIEFGKDYLVLVKKHRICVAADFADYYISDIDTGDTLATFDMRSPDVFSPSGADLSRGVDRNEVVVIIDSVEIK